jgi:hypothetical protein
MNEKINDLINFNLKIENDESLPMEIKVASNVFTKKISSKTREIDDRQIFNEYCIILLPKFSKEQTDKRWFEIILKLPIDYKEGYSDNLVNRAIELFKENEQFRIAFLNIDTYTCMMIKVMMYEYLAEADEEILDMLVDKMFPFSVKIQKEFLSMYGEFRLDHEQKNTILKFIKTDFDELTYFGIKFNEKNINFILENKNNELYEYLTQTNKDHDSESDDGSGSESGDE